MNWYLDVLEKYAVFSGRARRSEYWLFCLVNLLVFVLIASIDSLLSSGGILGGMYSLVILLPSLAVCVRRLHDTGRSGWWMLVGLIPVLGTLVLLAFLIQDSDDSCNQFGPYPKSLNALSL
ncbi:DUF805 domain-containing protein [Pontibacter sp. JAM-7]|uniref:DUF805 domain-containing protein n=1 Tax=Pontibacter sp. JAM-7 TaxID=3366581 RepID=UPI003AF9EE68